MCAFVITGYCNTLWQPLTKTRVPYRCFALRCQYFTLFSSLYSPFSSLTFSWPWLLSHSKSKAKQSFKMERLTKTRYFHIHIIEKAKKVFVTFDNVFHAYLMSGLKKYANLFFFHAGLFFKSTLSVLRCTWTGQINLKIFLGHHIKA